jgi:hypothetical protein
MQVDQLLLSIDVDVHELYIKFRIRQAPVSDRAHRSQICLEEEIYSDSDDPDECLEPEQKRQKMMDALEVRLSVWWSQSRETMNLNLEGMAEEEELSWMALCRKVTSIINDQNAQGEKRFRMLKQALRSFQGEDWAGNLLDSLKQLQGAMCLVGV